MLFEESEENKKKIILHIGVSSSNICDNDQKKHGKATSISKKNMIFFILTQTLSKSNSPTSSPAVLCCEIWCSR
jgi:hypothetical protein